ncbi:tetratricopeptide repeat protein [Desertibaculum subflavum]|uniref:tetratricopeptide repeat protein n=1 Tax=Desertibaculum subflavum TaxID=2268458 RepID=UPI000E670FE1
MRWLAAAAVALAAAGCAGDDAAEATRSPAEETRPMSPIERARARRFEEGYQAFAGKDYARAMTVWRELADAGDVAAMRNVGQLYRQGLGVEPDAVQAAAWFRRAAELGLVNAQANLGHLYMLGEGVAQDDAMAVKWLGEAARAGHPAAQFYLAEMVAQGRGVAANAELARALLEASAKAGFAPARDRLGLPPADSAPAQPQELPPKSAPDAVETNAPPPG